MIHTETPPTRQEAERDLHLDSLLPKPPWPTSPDPTNPWWEATTRHDEEPF